jgi:hypothetical protein
MVPGIFSQEKIVESVLVEKWLVPVYAVDSVGKSVTDLKKSDIELFVNNKKIKDFNFLKKDFFHHEKKKGFYRKPLEEEKVIVLVFDVALSESASIMKAKTVAEKLVKNAGSNTRFLIFTIEAFKGLSYLGGPTNDKTRIFDIIKKKVAGRDNQRSASNLASYGDWGSHVKYEESDLAFLMDQARRGLSDKTEHFASSFKALYYAISNIIGTKFIYLFTEGISGEAYVRGDTHGSKIARYLLRSGAVLFFINPTGGRGREAESGEEFLKGLSTLSGGKYLYGDTKKISREISSVHKAYYELSFESPDDQRGGMLIINIKSRRRGVKILTIRNLEKSKGYLALNNFEKKLMVLNMVSKNRNFKLPVRYEDVKITQEKKGVRENEYQVFIPRHFRDRNLDLFQVNLSAENNNHIIKKSSVFLSSDKTWVKMENRENYHNYFVLLNYELGMALVKGISIQKIKITDISFRNNILSFNLSGYQKKKYKNKNVGLFQVSIKVLNNNGLEISSDQKEITSLKNKTALKIPIKGDLPENHNFLIIARDLVTGQETNATHPIAD